MNMLSNVQKLIDKGISEVSGGPGGGLAALLKPAALGGLAGLLLTSKAARGAAGGALLAGVGSLLWSKYQNRIKETKTAHAIDMEPRVSTPEKKAELLVRALIFAARSDGHIDATEQQAIYAKIQEMNLDREIRHLIDKSLNEPLNPELIASQVNSEEEALEIYSLSCAVIVPDHFLERSYLDALAKALHIPDDVKTDLEDKIYH
jgi:uncharacterized membrane protein YebE (DUF533 family)